MPTEDKQDEAARLRHELTASRAEAERLKERSAACLLVIGILAVATLSLWSQNSRYQESINNYHEEVIAIGRQVGSLAATIDDLTDESANFDDGLTDWKDIVPEIKQKAEEASDEVTGVKESVNELDMRMTPSDDDFEPLDDPRN